MTKSYQAITENDRRDTTWEESQRHTFYEPNEAHPAFNYTRLVNKGLDPDLCPGDTVFYDKPANFLNKYKWIILSVLMLLY